MSVVVVLILESVPESLRGQLSKWMLEPKACVFVGRVSAGVRDLLWEKVCREVDEGGATMIFRSDNEQGFSIRSFGDTRRRIEDWEGIQLVLRPHPPAETSAESTLDEKHDWNAKLHPSIWAKTPRFVDLAPDEPRWHPLIAHLIDVAMVSRVMWNELIPPIVKERITADLGFENFDDAARWIAFFVGLHDIGKATPGFALKWDEGRERLLDEGFRPQSQSLFGSAGKSSVPPHGFISSVLIRDLLSRVGVDRLSATAIGFAVGGHHGILPYPGARNEAAKHSGRKRWKEAQEDLVDVLAHVLGLDQRTVPTLGLHMNRGFLIWLAGFTSVADWIGSNHEFFRFAGDTISLPQYVEHAEKAALRALKRLGWFYRSEGVAAKSFVDLVDRIPNALQSQVEEVSTQLDGQSLVIIEYPMGGGKTEAAFYLANTLQAHAGNYGLYMAMPSMATSNQMFERTVAFLRNCFPEDTLNVQLLHGRADLNPKFDRLLEQEMKVASSLAIESDAGEKVSGSVGVLAAEWFTHRKHGLLAPYGIGTVDQALMGALSVKHFFVRIFGLAGKVVVFDEVHALDRYMRSLFSNLLGWLAACGSSVVLLSATLPADVREELVTSFLKGMGRTDIVIPEPVPYPRITWISQHGTGCRHLARATEKEVYLRKFVVRADDEGNETEDDFDIGCNDDTKWITALKEKLAAGGCAAVICNTVGRAQQVYKLLKKHFAPEELILFHARFPIEDRARLEDQVLRYFGKDTGYRPYRMICVATQVIEQSLDLDFDLMISELSPIELILQRSGRMWRHQRPDRPSHFERQELWILIPSLVDGVPRFRRGDESIYDAHALLRSYLEIESIESFRIPGDVDDLIEAVYKPGSPSEELPEKLAEYWRETSMASEDSDLRKEGKAARNMAPTVDTELLDFIQANLDDESEEVHSAHRGATRLGGPSVEVVCLYVDDSGVVSLDPEGEHRVAMDRKPDADMVRALLGRSMRLSFHPQMVREILELQPPDVWDVTVHLRRHRALYFNADGTCVTGGLPLVLDPVLGLLYDPKKGGGR